MSQITEGTGRASTSTIAHDIVEASARLGAYDTRGRLMHAGRFGEPLKYDESGFPIRQQDRAGFTRRVRQLLRG